MIIESTPRFLPKSFAQNDGITSGSRISLRSTIGGHFLDYQNSDPSSTKSIKSSSTHRSKSAVIHILSTASNLRSHIYYGEPCYLAFSVNPVNSLFPAYLLSITDPSGGHGDPTIRLNYAESAPEYPLPSSQWLFYSYKIDGRPGISKYEENKPINIKSAVFLQSRINGQFLGASSKGQIVSTSNIISEISQKYSLWNIILPGQPIIPSWLDSAFPTRLLSYSPVDHFLLDHNGHESSFKNLKAILKFQSNIRNASSTKFGNAQTMEQHLISHWPSMTRGVKEKILLSDILWCLMGTDGLLISISEESKIDSATIYQLLPQYYVKLHHLLGENTENISEDSSLKSIVLSILAVSCLYRTVNKFLDLNSSSSNRGKIFQSFCTSLNRILSQFWQLIAKLESQLKSGSLSLQSLNILMQPSLKTFSLLKSLVESIHNKAIENLNKPNNSVLQSIGSLLKELTIGDSNRQICEFLLHNSSTPLCRMVENWIYYGTIEDNFDEFFISENILFDKDPKAQNLRNVNLRTEFLETRQFFNALTLSEDGKQIVNYWEGKFLLIQERVPFFLENFSNKIFLTGKYLNVLKKCNSFQNENSNIPSRISTNFSLLSDIEYTSIHYSPDFDDIFFNSIQKTYEIASKCLISCFFIDYDLIGRLIFMKNFFLLAKSDFLTTFLDTAETELDKPNPSISHLDSILDLSIRLSSCGTEKYKNDIFVVLHEIGTISDSLKWLLSADENRRHQIFSPPVTGNSWQNEPMKYVHNSSMEAFKRFTLWYSPEWPLNLFFNEKAIFKYQLIFRLLTHFKWVERKLHDVWRDHTMCKEVISLNLREKYNSDYEKSSELRMKYQLLYSISIREKMLHFCRNFIFYATVEIIDPSFIQLISDLKNSNSFDHMLELHDNFLDYVLHKCLLTDGPLLAVLTKVLSTCHIFTRYVLRLFISKTNQVNSLYQSRDGRSTRLNIMRTHLETILQDDNYLTMIKNAANHFEKNFKEFLYQLRSHSKLHGQHDFDYLLTRLDYNHYYPKPQLEDAAILYNNQKIRGESDINKVNSSFRMTSSPSHDFSSKHPSEHDYKESHFKNSESHLTSPLSGISEHPNMNYNSIDNSFKSLSDTQGSDQSKLNQSLINLLVTNSSPFSKSIEKEETPFYHRRTAFFGSTPPFQTPES